MKVKEAQKLTLIKIQVAIDNETLPFDLKLRIIEDIIGHYKYSMTMDTPPPFRDTTTDA